MLRSGSVLLALVVTLASGCYRGARTPDSPVQDVAAVPEEKLGVGDVFEVRVLAEPELSGTYSVAADGTIDYPFAGRLNVLGKTPGEVAAMVTAALRDQYLKHPQISVMVKEWNSRKIVVLGQVQKPGPVTYFARMTIVDAIAAAGSFTGIAKTNSVTLRREKSGKVESRVYPVAEIMEGKRPNVPVLPGDVIVVEERLF